MIKLNLVYFTSILNRNVYDEFGDILGKLKDVYVSTEKGYPIFIGYKILKNREDFYYEFRNINFYEDRGKILIKVSGVFNIIPQSYKYILSKHLLNKQIVDINGKKVVKIMDFHIANICGEVRIVAVESGFTSYLRRFNVKNVPLLLKKIINYIFKKSVDTVIKWEDMESVEFAENNLSISIPHQKISTMHPADIVSILEDLNDNDRKRLFESFNDDLASEILEEMEDNNIRVDLIKNLSDSKIISILDYISNYELADILEEMDDKSKERILINLEESDINTIRTIMSYEDNTVGSIMNTEFISFNLNVKLGEMFDIIKDVNFKDEYLYNIYVVDEENILKGVIDFKSLMFGDRDVHVFDIMDVKFIFLYDEDELNKAVDKFLKYDLVSIPVVDKNMKICGSLFIHDILTKDFFKI